MSFKLPYSNQTNWGALVLAGPPGGPTVIGQAFGGGFYAGQISTAGTGVADYYLIVAPVSTGQTTTQWKTSGTLSPGTNSFIDGPANSAAMNDPTHPAAYFCEGLTIGGYSDWYMPARNELEILYYNLKPTTTANTTFGSGVNPNSVPPRTSNYTSGTPAQTSATDFQSGGLQAFTPVSFQASTEASATNIYTSFFSNGNQSSNGLKTGARPVRAVRRVGV